jgi:hypothetical protein
MAQYADFEKRKFLQWYITCNITWFMEFVQWLSFRKESVSETISVSILKCKCREVSSKLGLIKELLPVTEPPKLVQQLSMSAGPVTENSAFQSDPTNWPFHVGMGTYHILEKFCCLWNNR